MIKTLKTRLLLLLSCLAFTVMMHGQSYKDVIQIYRSDAPLGIEDIIIDNDQRYIVCGVGKHEKGEQIYFNDDRVLTLDDKFEGWSGNTLRLIIEIDDFNNYVDHKLVGFEEKIIRRIRIVDGEVYCLFAGEDFQYEVVRYNAGVNVETLFAFQDTQRITIRDFALDNDKLLVLGSVLVNESYIYYGQDTIWNPELEFKGFNYPGFVYCKDLAADTIIYSLGYGGKYYGIEIDGVQFRTNGEAFIWGKHASEFAVHGDTSDYKGGGPVDVDAYLMRLRADGGLIKLHSFSSTSTFDCLQSVWQGNDGAYYVSYTSGPTGSTYVDKVEDYKKTAPYLNSSTIYKFAESGNMEWSLPISNVYGLGCIVYGEDNDYIYALTDLASNQLPLKIGDDEYALENAEDKESYTVLLRLDKRSGAVVSKSGPFNNGKGVRYNTGLFRNSSHTIVLRFEDTDVVIDDEEYPKYVEGFNMDAMINVDFTSSAFDIEERLDADIYPNPLTMGNNLTVESKIDNRLDYQLITINGTILQAGSVENGQIELSKTDIPSGIYLLKLLMGESTIIKSVYINQK